jgi:hypothetical protein
MRNDSGSEDYASTEKYFLVLRGQRIYFPGILIRTNELKRLVILYVNNLWPYN